MYNQDYFSNKAIIQNRRADKVLPRQSKGKGIIITKPLLYEILRDLFKKKKIKAMNNKMTTNSQLLMTESKTKQKQTKQTTRRGTVSQKWRSHGGLSAGSGENWGKGTGNKKHNWQVQNRQGGVKNSIGDGEAKELVCTIHGHEKEWQMLEGLGCAGQRGHKRKKKMGKL